MVKAARDGDGVAQEGTTTAPETVAQAVLPLLLFLSLLFPTRCGRQRPAVLQHNGTAEPPLSPPLAGEDLPT